MSELLESDEDLIVIAPSDPARTTSGASVVRFEEEFDDEGEKEAALAAVQGAREGREDPYSVDDVEPMGRTQKVVILLVIAALVFLAFYLLRYWGLL